MTYRAKVNDIDVTYKNRTVLEIVKQYVKQNKNTTYLELKEEFPDRLQGSIGVLKNEKDLIEWEKRTENKKDTREERFFTKGSEILSLGSEKIYVCTQWGDSIGEKAIPNFMPFVEYVKEKLGFKIEDNSHEINLDKKSTELINPPNNISYSLNKILYGPPGTGKTYHTIDKALQIIDGTVPDNRKEAKERFEVLKNAGQIEFVTFHQSYGYEEFVEGIKAIPSGKEGNDSDEMIYDVISGIFRKIAKKALINYSSNDTDIFEVKSFELNATSLNIQAKMIQDDENTYRVLKDSKIRKDEAPSFSQYNYSTLRNMVLKKAKLKEESEFYILQEDYTFQSMSAASSVILGRMSNGLRDWKEIINYDVNVKNNKKYILIIDEINRGNISKIFGELITLIEESKRLGNEEAMEVTLPYSGDKFGVPKNLYVIGTMNTADRSIALMDTALRRRFEFEEMMPKPELLSNDVEGIDLQKLLIKINQRIEYLYDRDHTIGHAYFIDVKDKVGLDSAMKNKVIPLLQEYFYDDWEKIRLVLNDGFIERDTQDASKLFDAIDDEYIEDDKYVYSIANNFSVESYVKIYAKIEHIEEGA